MVVVDLDGNVDREASGGRRPTRPRTSPCTARSRNGGVVHTHSTWGVAWAQAQREIPLLGTTHADLCALSVPVTRALTDEEMASDYEGATGTTLIEADLRARPAELPCALVAGTGCSAGLRPRGGGRGCGHARGGGADDALDDDAGADETPLARGGPRQALRAQARAAAYYGQS